VVGLLQLALYTGVFCTGDHLKLKELVFLTVLFKQLALL